MAFPLKIGIDVTAAIVQGGGIGRYTRELIHALTAVDQKNNYRFFSAKRPSPLPVANPLPSAPNIQYHPAPVGERWLYRLWYRFRLPLPVQWTTGKLDLFHSPDFVLPPTNGRIPTLLTVHDISFVHYPHTFPPKLVNYLNAVVPWSIKRATRVLADSQATKQDLIEAWRVPEDKISVLYSGVDGRFQPVAEAKKLVEVRSVYNLGQAPYLLCVGTVQPRKNYPLLVRAFGRLTADFPHNLVIAGGKGWLNEELAAEIEQLGLGSRVLFTGFVDDADLPALYSGADALAFPSLYEGFGLPLLEAMACGTPVVSSNVSSLPEVAGDAAIQLPPNNEEAWTAVLRQLLNAPDQRARMIEAGFKQASRFSWQKAAVQLLDIYQNL